MGRKGRKRQNSSNEDMSENRAENQVKQPPINTLEVDDFMCKEHWDRFFFTKGGCDNFPEWYADWPQLRSLVTSHLSFFPSSSSSESAGAPPLSREPPSVRILVAGCGNSRLSEHLYDAGFTNITNVDFSGVVISHMLERNVRERPLMKWRVMDMTTMKFANETFDAIFDKGGLDLLVEPEVGPRNGNLYLSEVKRLLKAGGKYICVTLGEPDVLGLLFQKLCFGWKMDLYAIAHEPSSGDLEQPFMVVAEKLVSTAVSQISLCLDKYSAECHGYLADEFYEELEREKIVRTGYSNASDVFVPLEDLILREKANFTLFVPGRRVKLILGEPGVSCFFYECILLDAQLVSQPFSHVFFVFIVPKSCTLEWMLSFSEGQWILVESYKTARLLMIMLDSRHSNAQMDDILDDLKPLVKPLFPVGYNGDDGILYELKCIGLLVSKPFPFDMPQFIHLQGIRYMVAGDGIKQRKIVHQVTSPLNGPIVVDDVVYKRTGYKYPVIDIMIRRLTVDSLVVSEVLLAREQTIGTSKEVEQKKVQETSKSSKKGKQKKVDSHPSRSHGEASSCGLEVNHNYLATPYHNAIISGLMLFSVHLKGSISAGGLVNTLVIGLGAGLLPTFMNNHLPFLNIEVVELDPLILEVAKEYFDFKEDERLKVHITDEVKFVKEKSDSDAEGTCSSKTDILIVDVGSPNSMCGWTSPPAVFLKESFFLDVKNSLSEQGIFVINLVTREVRERGSLYSILKKVFSNLFSLQLEEDVNEVIFALKSDSPIKEDQLCEARTALAALLELEKQEWSQNVIDASILIKRARFAAWS
ncbi:hypothetical protein OROMI_006654 [Orobanche minor]